jgi:hypothetical protein
MGKFRAGDKFVSRKDGKAHTGEVLCDFGETYLVTWDHMLGTWYLPAQIVDSYDKEEEGDLYDGTYNSPVGTLCGRLPASGQGDGQEQIGKD